jgi:hypothetical protein
MPGANAYVSVVTEISHRELGAVGKPVVGRKPTRNDPPASSTSA